MSKEEYAVSLTGTEAKRHYEYLESCDQRDTLVMVRIAGGFIH
jgi:hypothetical protein